MTLSPEKHLQVAMEHAEEVRGAGIKADPEICEVLSGRVNSELAEDEQELLRRCLLDNADVFALTNSQLGRTNWVEMDIDTGDATPIAVQPYRMARKELDALKAEVERLLKDDIMVKVQDGKGTHFTFSTKMLMVPSAH
ncbi:hypothetical protein GPECTOR_833g66 [Gonium pectorale]|uniref:Uncharacterized protein n=1 Tax=Gonium pectorale TaxID=33097 RepID=A0A150FTY7_GONPE|nr:hypothetical protein GPECTOR_833g66 [Gonium pectorale]|eukprot:KXZ41082.1 hypothetical protein GPECTOR_833g66 [Gonium pectorale]